MSDPAVQNLAAGDYIAVIGVLVQDSELKVIPRNAYDVYDYTYNGR